MARRHSSLIYHLFCSDEFPLRTLLVIARGEPPWDLQRKGSLILLGRNGLVDGKSKLVPTKRREPGKRSASRVVTAPSTKNSCLDILWPQTQTNSNHIRKIIVTEHVQHVPLPLNYNSFSMSKKTELLWKKSIRNVNLGRMRPTLATASSASYQICTYVYTCVYTYIHMYLVQHRFRSTYQHLKMLPYGPISCCSHRCSVPLPSHPTWLVAWQSPFALQPGMAASWHRSPWLFVDMKS